ncbi:MULTISPECIES: N-acetylmuramic acid 6-phosphate etherase [unclassified Lactococcus]|uniref:N-acetylmuramic acid 6-phosphate etherase n=1 Tax=unclassified Lactococcus TaxID=2643510 RepID=UPI0011C9CA95|nr:MULTISPECIES: N-acetylmuramic acid 6-phosphate etherase [unclassified Lactococcus]MQW23371.1 N-acetylmuramic acid 6-phosphate etherase [Lactococcus sp. dk101]TXK37928.1 N-acetylmuramic acid 6-phosphate etherase [Lactococcus sp. dk310]TXK49582.1 N-acetylmuramic acid 6-phosphate etherase [Lactococcus sp. dk322]
MINLDHLTTEKNNEKSVHLDEMTVGESLIAMNNEDKQVAQAVEGILPVIEKVVEAVIDSFNHQGRLIYFGAGTSGRLGILDAAECVPTFGIDSEMVVGLIAGGPSAMINAIEGAEDDASLGKFDLEQLHLNANDTVIGIAASGRTPYVIGGLDYANSIGATTVSLACNKNAKMSSHAKYPIEVDCGPEFLTGSTRLKVGSAQKMILNMISTLSMVGIGKVYKNLMVDLKPTNLKLVERSKHIIMQATGCTYDQAENLFEASGENVKTAIVMFLTHSTFEEAEVLLKATNGFVRKSIQ